MKNLIKTLKNIWSIEDLRSKILYTLLLIFIYRIGTFIVLPGIDASKLSQQMSGSKNGMLGLIDTFSGGAFLQASIFALGIMPYISASIFIQLMTVLVPQFQKMQKEGESGRKKINQWTRYLTIGVTAVQASAYVAYLRTITSQSGGITESFAPYFWLSTVLLLIAGTMFVMWMGEKITDKGLGNGTSLIIMIGILGRLPRAFGQELVAKSTRSGQILIFIIEIALLIAIILGCILLVQGVRKIPV
ncbi:MAG: preprotein translocase subunit SecY, partial [Flavisolibacter sp.]